MEIPVAPWQRLVRAAIFATVIAVVPGMVSTAFDLFGRSTLRADGIPPGTDPSTTTCASDQVQIWLWDSYNSLWGRRCVGDGKTVLSSEGDIVAVPTAADLPSSVLDLIDQTADVATLTAGASIAPVLSEHVAGRLKQSTSCLVPPNGVGCDKGPTAVVCNNDGSGCDDPLVPHVTRDDATAPDVGGSVGLYAVPATPTGGAPQITFTWDISRWAKGDVFAGLHGGMLKVYDRDFNFKRYIALSDYARYGTWDTANRRLLLPAPNASEPGANPVIVQMPADWSDADDGGNYTIGLYVSGCGVDFKTGNVHVTNSDIFDPGINVIGRQPGVGISGHGDLPYADLSRRMSTMRRPASDPQGMPIDISPESVKFDANGNMYVGHAGGYFNPDGFTFDVNDVPLFDSNGQVYDVDGVTPLSTVTGFGVNSWEMSGRMDPAAALAPFWENQALAWQDRSKTKCDGPGCVSNPSCTTPGPEPEDQCEIVPDPWAWLTYQSSGQKVPFRRQYGARMHVYNYNGTGWDATPSVHSPFVSQAGTDWIELTAPDGGSSPTVLYTSEYGDIFRYKPGAGQLTNVNDTRLHPGKMHAVRLLPPGDGTDMIVAATNFTNLEDNQLMRVQIINGQTVITPYLVDLARENLTTQPAWYALDISPDGRTMWAFPFLSGDLYQFDVATGQYTARKIATFNNETPFDGQGVCIMWQYNTHQEICGNGIDDDDNGLVDENCQPIPALTSAGSNPVAQNDAYSTPENTTLTISSSVGIRVNDGTEFNRHTLTTVLVSGPSNGDATFGTNGLILGPDGAFSYRPAAGFHGQDTFTYLVEDGAERQSEPATVTITVWPHVTDDVYAVAHQGAISVLARQASPAGLFVNDSTDPLSVSKVGPSTSVELTVGAGTSFPTINSGTVTISSDGNFTYTPNVGFVGVDHFYYRASDASSDGLNTNTSLYGSTAKFAKVSITVSNATVPTALDNIYGTNEWTPLAPASSRNILDNDSDVDGDVLRVSQLIVGGIDYSHRIIGADSTGTVDTCLTQGGQLKLWWDGTFEYIPQGSGCPFAEAPTTATFQYRASDGHSATNLATVFINVTGNEAPVAFDNAYTTKEDVELVRDAARNLILNPDSLQQTDLDPDVGDTFRVTHWWYNDPLDPINTDTGQPWDCKIASDRVHCISAGLSSESAANDTCLIGGGSVKVWPDGTFAYNPVSSGCPFVQGPIKQKFWYAVTDDKNAMSNVAEVAISITAPLTVNANSKERLYGQVNPALDWTLTLRGIPFTPQVGDLSGNVECITTAEPTSPVGNYPIYCDQGDLTSELYHLIYQQGTLRVNPTPLIITAHDKDKNYDGAPFTAFTSSFSGFVNGENESVLGGTLTHAGPAAGAINANSYAINPGGLSSTNYAISYAPGTLTINRVPLLVKADDKHKIYDGVQFTAFTSSFSGFVNGENESVLGGTLGYTGPAVTALAVNTTTGYEIVPGGLTSTNYDITFQSGILTIERMSVQVVVTGGTFAYNGLARSATCEVISTDEAELTGTLSYVPAGVTNVGSYEATCNFAGDDTHTAASGTGTVTITAVPLTIKADNQSKQYDRQPFTGFTSTYSGFVNSETASVLSGTLTYGGAAVGATNVNLAGYAIVPGGLTSLNYSPITYVPGVLSITPAPLTITANNATKGLGATLTFAGTEFTSSGLFSPDAATSATITSSGAISTATTGTYPIVVSNAAGSGLANYNITYHDGLLTVVDLVCATTGTTYTQGGWGSNPSGANPGSILAANFAAVYPGRSVQIGGLNKLTFTSAAAIRKFLPAGGTARALTSSATNPNRSSAGVFAGQVLALQLSVDFSTAGVTRAGLAYFVVGSGPLAGMSVSQVLALSNAALGGLPLPAGITVSLLNNVVTNINENFVDGTTDRGYLLPAPGCGAPAPATVVSNSIDPVAKKTRK